MFDPWLTCCHTYVRTIADNTISHWRWVADRGRRRALRGVDRANRDLLLRTTLANLALAVASGGPEPTIGVSLRSAKQKTTRYDRAGFRGLPRMLETLSTQASGSMLSVHVSHEKGLASTVRPAPWLLEDLRRFRLGARHFGQAAGRETIILSRTDRDNFGEIVRRERIDYGEAAAHATEQLRSEMRRINEFLAVARIDFEDDGGPRVPTDRRTLRRRFNLPPDSPEGTIRFDLGGRLFGGWWSDLPKVRRSSIRIDGEPIVDLDFASMFLRLAYIEAGHAPPPGDLYAGIPGLSEPRWRPGVKKVVSAMLFRMGPLTRLPRGTRNELPSGLSGPQLRAAILAAHPALAGVLETGIGLRLMCVESQILVAVLLELAGAGVAALAMHDGIMVAGSKRAVAERTMGDAAEEITGHRLPTVWNTWGNNGPP